jgi:iron(III) transport system substrate-binding protein
MLGLPRQFLSGAREMQHIDSKTQHTFRLCDALRGAVLLLGCCTLSPVVGQGNAQPASEPWDRVLPAARKEATVALYSAVQAPTLQRLKDGFEKAFPGMTLEAVRYPSGELMAKLEQERASRVVGADVVISTELNWFEERSRDRSLTRAFGPDSTKFPAKYIVGGTAPILGIDAIVMMYNTNLVKTPITSHLDLLRPELKGKIGTLDLLSNTVVAFNLWLEQTNGSSYLERLAAQQPRLYTSTVGGGQSLAAGEVAVMNFAALGGALPLVRSGAPVKVVFPNPSFGTAYVGAIVNWAGHPNAAQVFMNYLMSVAGQTAWHGLGDSASPLPTIPGSLDASTIQLADLSKLTPETTKVFTARWNKAFK